MDARAYFADKCTAGAYDNTQYLALDLLGKVLSYSVDLSGAGCGCNAAFYLTSMRQNAAPSQCSDHYCDANNVCGESCAEIDIQEANQLAWHSTLHTATDASGVGGGYGGGDSWTGPRDWGSAEYGEGARCVDTARPFQVEAAFPVDDKGSLVAMEVTLSQPGKPCNVSVRLGSYDGMAELSRALEAGMTPIVSYWSANDMLWMDGKGADGKGPCAVDDVKACSETVTFHNFSVAPIVVPPPRATHSQSNASSGPAASTAAAPKAHAAVACPGEFDMPGYGSVQLIPTGWADPEGLKPVDVTGRGELVAHMDGRAYFADECTAGKYDNTQYLALDLLGKVLSYSVDLSGAGCGCNAAFYLTSMRQNAAPSQCSDHYCDANNVCGESCAEIDIQEANQLAWHSTLHTATDASGVGGGYGGGDSWTGPRDWGSAEYGEGARCVDTARPFQVEAAFPVDDKGSLVAMEVTLSQPGKPCNVSVRLGSYDGMAELSRALEAGMTPIVSYWSANDMLWMDGKGADGKGPCAVDDVKACSETVTFHNFSVAPIVVPPPRATHSQSNASSGPAASTAAAPKAHAAVACPGEFDMPGYGSVHSSRPAGLTRRASSPWT
ncbi:unnamed protein product [Prorocentrum cordatum]|uniref:cellulose 1,4-beta-cellobiosidase (non-reducing end) n=1 Tax=Prorocentrum cordatum TaxID=2364126 RepID=A0ABN9W2R4_9DINO|nr:unnamed protein product [Polarella glacialis]